MAGAQAQERPVIVFDLGGVLIDWNPRHLYRKLFDDDAAMERFLEEVCHGAWNLEQDRGRTVRRRDRGGGAAPPGPARHDRGLPHALGRDAGGCDRGQRRDPRGAGGQRATSCTRSPTGRRRRFRSRARALPSSIASRPSWSRAHERLVKPDARIFQLLLERITHPAQRCVYIDDSPPNVAAAAALGFDAIHFTAPSQLRAALAERGLLAAPEQV